MESNSKKDFWASKPFWCKPWSIISVGILGVIFSWILLNNIIITITLGIFIIAWWVVFLILVPNSYNVSYDNK